MFSSGKIFYVMYDCNIFLIDMYDCNICLRYGVFTVPLFPTGKKHENCYLLVSKVFFWLISFCHKDDIYLFFFFFFFFLGEGCWSRVFLFRINFRLEGLFNLIWLLFWVVVCVIKFSFFVHSFFWLLHFSNEVIFS